MQKTRTTTKIRTHRQTAPHRYVHTNSKRSLHTCVHRQTSPQICAHKQQKILTYMCASTNIPTDMYMQTEKHPHRYVHLRTAPNMVTSSTPTACWLGVKHQFTYLPIACTQVDPLMTGSPHNRWIHYFTSTVWKKFFSTLWTLSRDNALCSHWSSQMGWKRLPT